MTLLLCAALVFSAQLTVSAAAYPAGIDESLTRMVDGASLLMSVPAEALGARARDMAKQYRMDIVIVTRRGLDGKTPMDYADDFFDYEGYGWRDQATDDIKTGSGILLLVDMQERDIWISTKGEGMSAFPDSLVNRIIDAISPELGSGQYRAAFSRFLDEVEKRLQALAPGDTPGSVSTSASEATGEYPAGIDEELPRVTDDARLLTGEELEALEARARDLIAQYQMDLVIVAKRGLDGKTPMDYADDFFDYGGYGWRDDAAGDITEGSGMLLLVDMEGRDIWISTKGRGMTVFDGEIDAMIDAISPELGEGLYYDAFDRFLDEAQGYLHSYVASGDDGDDYYYGGDYGSGYAYSGGFYFNMGLFIVVSLIGLIIAFAVVGSMKRKHNTIRTATTAQSYQQAFNLTERQDIFLYSNTTRTRLPEPATSSGGHISSSGSSHGGGGGSFGGGHSSSSGSSHGGGGGKF